MKSDAGAGRDVVSALAGKQANRECAVGYKTRRVVLASLGVIQEQKAGRKRVRAVALAASLIFVLLLGPSLWWVAESLGFDDRLSGLIAVNVAFLASALLAAALVAGWARNRS
jgi:apolipoprotein N-acyltransferase